MSRPDPIGKNRSWWNRTAADYQRDHGPQLRDNPAAWGVWSVPEEELQALGEVRGERILELGCGAAQWSIELARRGGRSIGLDLSERQLQHARRLVDAAAVDVPLVHANAEAVPLRDAAFDLVFCDHGAMSYARPERTVAEAARLLRPGGRFVFSISSPLLEVCWDPQAETVTRRLVGDYFSLHEIEDERCVNYQLPYGEWIRLFRRHGFAVEDLIEIRAPADASTSYDDFVSRDWARRWPAEALWKLRKMTDRGDGQPCR